ncbi:MAG: hypothetical protein ACUVV0_10125 [Anaerolineae bacterium]
MEFKVKFFPVLVLLATLASGCASGTLPFSSETSTPAPTLTPTSTPAPFNLTILSTNDTWGYLLPCG